MKKISFLIVNFCLCSYGVFAGFFQAMVVSGDVIEVPANTRINTMDFLKADQVLLVSINSYLVLIDDKANTFELYGQSKILLDTLRGCSLMTHKFPDLKILFSPALPNVRGHNDAEHGIQFTNPFLFSDELLVDHNIFLQWVSNTPIQEGYKIRLLNVYDDQLFTNKIFVNEIKIEFTPDQMKENAILVIVESLKNGKQINSGYKKISFTKDNYRSNDVTNDLSAAAGCLIRALFAELNGINKDALEYYTKAAEIAPKVIEYKTILENFKTRWRLH